MNHRVNLQARIRRHSRILRDNLGNGLHTSSKKTLAYKVVACITVLLFPVYPVFAGFLNGSELDFDRVDIDESSIISIHEGFVESSDDDILVESKDSYLSVGALVEDDLSNSNEIIEYKVQEGDTLELIARKYGVTKNTILWESNLGEDYTAKLGDTLKFPPVTGVTYAVKKGETISGIARKYSVASDEIKKQNLLSNNVISPGQKLIIPGGEFIKEIPKKAPVVVARAAARQTTSRSAVAASTKSQSTYSASKGRYQLKWRKPFSGAWGNCTYYVASYKNVNWRGNANQWLRNARAKGHATGSNATLGAIIVFQGRGYNPYYGHVGIIMEVLPNHLIVSDMNYKAKNQVTYRKISRWDGAIKGYIYVGD